MTKNKKISRRNFIRLLAGTAAIVAGGSLWGLRKTPLGRDLETQARNLLQDKQTQYLRQLVTEDNNHTRRIMWAAESPMTNPQVCLRGQAESSIRQLFVPKDVSFTDDGENHRQYSAVMDNLNPDTAYEFSIRDGDAQSDWYPFRTSAEDKSKFSMLIFTDSQSSDYSDWRNVAQNAIKRHPEAEIFTNLGDLVDNGEDSSQWRAWFSALDGIIDKIPFAPVMGNHECYDRNWQERLPEGYLNYFEVPDNKSTGFGRYYYSFDYGQVHFTVINTQEEEIRDIRPGLMEEQLKWLENDLNTTKQKWKIVLMHRDVLQYRISRIPERKEGFSPEGILLMPLFEKHHVNIVLTGHLHTYRNRGHILQGEHNAHGPLYLLCGLSGNVRYDNLWTDHALDKVVAPQPETDNYLIMDVSDSEITLRCFLPDGKQLDEISIS
ncbi:MAG: metallophosphoesterase family protein [Anaerovibrio sp.]|uniref:purple acid phosphatase family protein n=1 Tax=Anaerovibrio sp. TaxID=1872532 RepID=UPI0025D06043|nr:metallophosphoesterase family protein [Anaerovibrio sp.]MCR5176961.1 metallophosphoesterase family protein [Anaerovibrio sp.]